MAFLIFLRPGNNHDAVDAYVLKAKHAETKEENKEEHCKKRNEKEKKPLVDKKKLVKFFNAPVTKFWCNVVRK